MWIEINKYRHEITNNQPTNWIQKSHFWRRLPEPILYAESKHVKNVKIHEHSNCHHNHNYYMYYMYYYYRYAIVRIQS